VTLQVSSINGFNVSQFLSTPSPYIQISTFGQLFTSSLVASDLSTVTLETSSINGYNISQLLNQPTVSSFQQLYTSSLQTQTISTTSVVAQNLSTFTLQALSLSGISSIDGYSIQQLVSSVAPQPPIPSTVLQFFTSSLATNVITNYQTQGVDITAPGYINIHAVTGVNIAGDNCNVSITSANKQELISYNTTSYSGNNWTATAQSNVVLNASNTIQIYNTNTAPVVSPNDFAVLAEGDLYLNGQRNTTLTAVKTLDLLGGLGVVLESPGAGDVNILTPSGKILLNSLSTVVQHDLNVQTINGAIYPPVVTPVNTYTNLYTTNLSNNLANSPNLYLGATSIYLDGNYGSGTVGLQANQVILNGSNSVNINTSNTVSIYNGLSPPAVPSHGILVDSVGTLALGSSNAVTIRGSNTINLNTPSTICSGDITAATFNGAPLPTGGGATVSTFNTLYTSTISGNPLNYLSLIANRSITLKSLSTITNAAGAWFSGDVRASTFNGQPLGSGGGWVGTAATDLNMNGYKITAPGTLDVEAAYNLNLNAGITSNILTLGGASVQVLPFRRFEVSFGTTDFQLNGGDLPNTANLQADYTALRGNSNILLTSPSTIITADLNVVTINGQTPGSGGWVGTATSDLNMATYSILNVTNINGSAYPPPYTPTWVGTASSDLNMATFSILNVTNINGASYPPASAWNGTATSALNMNGYDVYSSNLNLQTTSVNYYLSLNDGASKVDLYSSGELNLTGITSLNILTPVINLSNQYLSQGGQLTIDSNAQLNYATKANGYGTGSGCPISLTQGGSTRVVVSDTTDAFDVSVLLDCAYEDTSFSVVATSSEATTNVYYPGVLSYAVEISGSNSFNIICRATTTGTYNFNWITTGKYPRGAPV